MNKTLNALASLGIVACATVSTANAAITLTAQNVTVDTSTNIATITATGATTDTGLSAFLSETVKLTFSKSVVADVYADATNNVLAVATCHPNGKKDATASTPTVFVATSFGGKTASDTTSSAKCTGASDLTASVSAVATKLSQ